MKPRNLTLLTTVAFSAFAALPLAAQSAEGPANPEFAFECRSGPSYSTRLEWGLPTTDCTAIPQAGTKAPGGVMGPVRSAEDMPDQGPGGREPYATPGSVGNLQPY